MAKVADQEETYLFGIPYVKLETYAVKAPIGNEPTPVSDGLNVELLTQVFKYIKNNPQTWRQQTWYAIVDRNSGDRTFEIREEIVEDANKCGTSFCFAGHVAIREGFALPPKDNDETWSRRFVDAEGYNDYEEVDEFASKRLGLDYNQAEALFSGGNTMDDIEFIVRILVTSDGDLDGYELEELISDYRNWQEEDNPKTMEQIWDEFRAESREDWPALVEL